MVIHSEHPIDVRLGCAAVVCADPCPDIEADENWPTTGQHRGRDKVLGAVSSQWTAWIGGPRQHILYLEMMESGADAHHHPTATIVALQTMRWRATAQAD